MTGEEQKSLECLPMLITYVSNHMRYYTNSRYLRGVDMLQKNPADSFLVIALKVVREYLGEQGVNERKSSATESRSDYRTKLDNSVCALQPRFGIYI